MFAYLTLTGLQQPPWLNFHLSLLRVFSREEGRRLFREKNCQPYLSFVILLSNVPKEFYLMLLMYFFS